MTDSEMVVPKIGSLEDEALKRKQRLEELRNKRKHQSTDKISSETKINQLPKPKFRNYNPTDESLKENTLPKVTPENVKDQLTEELKIAKSKDALLEDIDLTKLAPRKIDWDLKRNIAKKMDKLEKKTQIAIAELIRERLKTTKIDDLDQATQDLESTTKNLDIDDDIDD